MSKDLWLSQFDPASPLTWSDVEPYPVDVRVVSNNLTLVYSDDTNRIIGPFRGPTGQQIETLTLTEDKRIEQILNTGDVLITDPIKQDLVEEIALLTGSYGVYRGLVPEVLGNKLPYDTLRAINLMSLVSADGDTVSASDLVTNFGNSLLKVFNGTTVNGTDGYRWGNTTGDRSISIVFSKFKYVDGFLLRNMRTDGWAVRQYRVEYLTADGWLETEVRDLTGDILAEDFIELDQPVLVSAVKLVILVGNTVGRFEVYLDRFATESFKSSVAVFSPLLIDQSRINVEETQTAIELSLKQSGTDNDTTTYTLSTDQYLCLNYTNVENKVLTATGYATTITYNAVMTNTLQAEIRNQFIKLTKGLYRIKAELVVDGTGHSTFYVVDGRHGYPIAYPSELYVGSTVMGSLPVVCDVEFTLFEDTYVAVKVVTSANSTALHGTRSAVQPTHNRLSGILEVWKLSDDTNSLLPAPYIDPPEGATPLMAPYHWLGGTLVGGGDGRGLFDGQYASLITGLNSNYWNAAGHYVTIRVDSDFNLWRRGISGQPTYNASLIITRLEDGVDYSHCQLAEVNNDGSSWTQYTTTLPYGTYRFENDGARLRADSEWFIEYVPIDLSNRARKTRSIYSPMTTNATDTQLVSSSSIYSGALPTYAPWHAFKGAAWTGGLVCWASTNAPASVEVPHWIQIEFTDGPRALDRYVIHNRAGAAGVNPPRDFRLLGRNSDTEDWTVINEVIDAPAKAIYSRSFYDVSRVSFSIYRLEITRSWPISNSFVAIEYLELLQFVDEE